MKGRLRHYLPFVGIPNLVLVLGIVVMCLGTILLGGGRPAALPAAIAETWFVIHGVPVIFDGVTLGAIPLLPVIGVIALIAWRVRVATKDRVSILDLYAIAGLVILIPFTLSAIAWFMVNDASAVFPVQPPAILKGLFIPVFVHLVGMGCGMSGKLWKALFLRTGLPAELVDAIGTTTQLALRLTGAGLVVFLVLLALGAPRIGELLDAYPSLGAGGATGLFGASVLYLPNAAVSTLAVLLGTPFAIAEGAVSLFGAALPPLPPMPLFAALPGEVAAWAPVLLLIPVGLVIHFFIRRRLSLIEVAASAAWAAIIAVTAGLFSGGQVGAYGWVGPSPWIFGLAALLWVGGVAVIAWAVAAFARPRTEEPEEEPEEELEEVEAAEEDLEEEQSLDDDRREAKEPQEEPSGGSTAYSVLKAEADDEVSPEDSKD